MEEEETMYRNSLLRQTLDSQKEKIEMLEDDLRKEKKKSKIREMIGDGLKLSLEIIIGLAILCTFVAIIALSCTAIYAVINNGEQEQQLNSCLSAQQASVNQCQQALEQLQEEIDLECTVDQAMERAVQRALQGRSE